LTRLWHQLTVRLQELVEQKESAGLLLALYEHFVSDWKSKMNKISLVKFLVVTSRQLEPQKALEFLTPFIDQLKEEKLCQGAYVLLLTESCVYKLSLAQLEECKDTLKICESLLDSQNEPIIHTTFYRINAEYYKKVNGYPEYYQNALLYLQSIDMNLVTPQERQERAFDLCFSALLGEGLYNFGELVHTIDIVVTPYSWLFRRYS
jgi:26S proteasome regulatory subunit N9